MCPPLASCTLILSKSSRSADVKSFDELTYFGSNFCAELISVFVFEFRLCLVLESVLESVSESVSNSNGFGIICPNSKYGFKLLSNSVFVFNSECPFVFVRSLSVPSDDLESCELFTSMLRLAFKSEGIFIFLLGDKGVREGGSKYSSFLSVGGKGVFGCKCAENHRGGRDGRGGEERGMGRDERKEERGKRRGEWEETREGRGEVERVEVEGNGNGRIVWGIRVRGREQLREGR